MKKRLIQVLTILSIALAGYIAWDVWYYWPLREKRNRTITFQKR